MAVGPKPAVVLFGRTSGGDNLPVRIGAPGNINGTTTGAVSTGPHAHRLGFGRTVLGVNVPLLVDTNGIVEFV